MKHTLYIALLLALTPTFVNALGLGRLDLSSALNEPFEAKIQLLSPTADELDSLEIGLADSAAFARAKIERSLILSKLKFAVRRAVDDGPDYIRVYSQTPIQEPFLNFLVEVSWSNGRLFREYTVLLDPPLYDPNPRARAFNQTQTQTQTQTQVQTQAGDASSVAITVRGEGVYVYETQTRAGDAPPPDNKVVDTFEQAPSTPDVRYPDGDYGPTAASDTLWSIAASMRANTSISINQMMLALLRANPDAFINQNINGLKRGQILRLPSESEITALSNAQALAEAQSQNAAWNVIRGNLASAVAARPDVSSVPETSPSSPTVEPEPVAERVESDAELKLVGAKDIGEGPQQASRVDSGSGEDLVLAQESIQALIYENMELKDRRQESEALLDDLKRLLALKEDELAALQAQAIAQSEAAKEAVVEPVVAEEIAVAEEITEDKATTDRAEDEMPVADEAEVETVDEAVADVIETEPVSSAAEDLGIVGRYLGPVKAILFGNPIIGAVIAVVLVLLIIIIAVLKLKKESAQTAHIDAMTEESFSDFDSDMDDDFDTGGGSLATEVITDVPDHEAESTTLSEESFDLNAGGEEDETQLAVEETVVENKADDGIDMQEVNTYLAFEQFDQAKEFVQNAINDSPTNAELHTKLLEVFYTSGNKKNYEEAAKALYDLVGGDSEYWNMAIAMWQEMSPNRALFEEGGEEDDVEDDDKDNTGGFLNVIANDKAGDDDKDNAGEFLNIIADDEAGDDGAGLDFDFGSAGDESGGGVAGTGEEILDITSTADDNLLDHTLNEETPETELSLNEETSATDPLDITPVKMDVDAPEDFLDTTATTNNTSPDNYTLLDFEVEAEENEVQEASNSIEFDVPDESNETVEFDVPAESSETVEFDASDESNETVEFDASDESNETMEFDLSDSDVAEASAEESTENDNVLDFNTKSVEGDDNTGLDVNAADDEITLEIDTESLVASEDEVSLDVDGVDAGEEEEPDLLLEGGDVPEPETAMSDMDFSLDDTPVKLEEAEFDLDKTVELPNSPLISEQTSNDSDAGDSAEQTSNDSDAGDSIVFIQKTAKPGEQSVEDENATKLDLAKAYVELGDKESAKVILDEVVADGSDDQRQQAEDLLGQV